MLNKTSLFLFIFFTSFALLISNFVHTPKRIGLYKHQKTESVQPIQPIQPIQTQDNVVEKDFSQEWLSLFSFKEICPEFFETKNSPEKQEAPWKRIPLELVFIKEILKNSSKNWQRSYWDGRDFRLNEATD